MTYGSLRGILLCLITAGDWEGKFNLEEHKHRLSVGICRALCAYNDQGLGIGVEAMAIPAMRSEAPGRRTWVLQDTVRNDKPMTNFLGAAMIGMGAVKDRVQHLSSIATTTTTSNSQQGQEEHKDGGGGSVDGALEQDDRVKVVADVVDDEDTHLVVLKPHQELCLGMNLGSAAAVVGVMIGRPINPRVAFSGSVDDQGLVFSRDGQNGTASTDQVHAMRKARVQHLIVGGAGVEDDDKAALFTAAEEDTSEELPSLKVIMITRLTDLVDDDYRSIIYGASWDKKALEQRWQPITTENVTKKVEREKEKEGLVEETVEQQCQPITEEGLDKEEEEKEKTERLVEEHLSNARYQLRTVYLDQMDGEYLCFGGVARTCRGRPPSHMP